MPLPFEVHGPNVLDASSSTNPAQNAGQVKVNVLPERDMFSVGVTGDVKAGMKPLCST